MNKLILYQSRKRNRDIKNPMYVDENNNKYMYFDTVIGKCLLCINKGRGIYHRTNTTNLYCKKCVIIKNEFINVTAKLPRKRRMIILC